MWDRMLSWSPLANFFWDLHCKIYFLLVGKIQYQLYVIVTVEMWVGFMLLNLKIFLLYCWCFYFKAFNQVVSPSFVCGAINL